MATESDSYQVQPVTILTIDSEAENHIYACVNEQVAMKYLLTYLKENWPNGYDRQIARLPADFPDKAPDNVEEAMHWYYEVYQPRIGHREYINWWTGEPFTE